MMDKHSEIHSALAKDFTTRRGLLRELATPILRDQNVKIANAMDASPLIGEDSHQISVRKTYTGLRDSMSIEGLVAVASESVTIDDVCDALVNPDDHGFVKTKSKCGYDLGRPRYYDDIAHLNTVDAIKAFATGAATPTPKVIGLEAIEIAEAIDLLDDIVFRGGIPLTSAVEATKAHGADAKMIDAAAEAIRMRGAVTEPPYMSEGLSKTSQRIRESLTTKEEPVKDTPTSARPTDADTKMIDLMLDAVKLPKVGTMLDTIDTLKAELATATEQLKTASMPAMPTEIEFTPDGKLPSGKVVVRKAYDVFNITAAGGKKLLNFDVPTWQWDAPHPHVPQQDPNYIFRPFELFRVLYALITNQRAYLHGHTGTGKTTLVEQVGAFLYWPVMRVNFDSEITRMDLIGRDVLSSVDGAPTSTFVDGILPQMMSGPYIGIFDEIDFVRPDVAYVMQRALEGNGLMLTEDGGRIVKPHKMFRMFATGNTVGQGDEFGMYQGARPQSMALLDRFTVWVKIDYMNEADRTALIKSVGKGLSASVIRQISQYVREHLEAFTTAKVLQPISPRTFLAFTSAASMFTSMDVNEPVKQALEATILDRASVQDRAVLNGLATRVFS